jgi:hypothetical protein
VTFLDSSVIVDMIEDVPEVVCYVESCGQPYFTSAMCVFEVVDGRVGGDETDVVGVRQEFAGVQAIEFNERIALEAGRIQDQLMSAGERMSPQDLIVAATARSTGDELVVTDDDFETTVLTELLNLTSLSKGG